jgi:hypothetical protein
MTPLMSGANFARRFFELDPIKLLERIAGARSAVLDRIEDRFSRPSDGEGHALPSALGALSTLRELAERDIGERKKTVQIPHLAAGYARNRKRESSA